MRRNRVLKQRSALRFGPSGIIRRLSAWEQLEPRAMLACDLPCLPGEIVEAEAGQLSGLMSIQTDPTASGGQYVAVPSGNYSSVPGNNFAEYRFLVQDADNYRLDTVVDGPDILSNSFFVTVDDQPAAGYLWDVPSGWTVDQVSDRAAADPVVLSLGVGEHTVRFHLREGGTRLDSVTLVALNPTIAPALPGEIVEAEAGLLSGRFTIQNDAMASGGQYVSTPDEIFMSAPANDFAEFRFLVSSAGDYRMDTIVDGPDGLSNSFFVTVDDQPATGYLWDVPSGWTVDQVSDRAAADPVVLSLGVGEHTVRFYVREGGARLDSVTLVELNPTISPALPGEIVEAEAGLLSGRFAVENEAAASGGQYVTTPNDIFASSPDGDFAEYRFLVQNAGDYRLDAVVDGPDDVSDSFLVTVDNEPIAGYLWDVPSGWTLDQLADRGGVDPVVLSLGVGEHTVRFHLREGGARLDSVTLVELTVPPALPGETVEAEAGFLSGRFAIQDDMTASGGQYVSTPDNSFAGSPGNDFAEYRFLVQNVGVYRLDAVVDGPDDVSDSFLVTVDDEPAAGYLWDVPSGWALDPLADRGRADPVVLSLGVGEHAVRFHLREGGARIDNVTLVDLNLEPGVIGLASGAVSVAEADGIATLTVSRTGGADGVVSVNYTTADDTAIAGEDYDLTSGTLVFQDGETSNTITVPITDDTVDEIDEQFTVTLSSPGGGATLGTVTANVTITDNDPTVSASGIGVIAEYFGSIDLTNRVLVRTDSTIDFDWGLGAPAAGIGSDGFSVRWTGQVEPRYTETYTFQTVSDDGVRLWIDNQLIIDQWNDHTVTAHTGTIALDAGQLYSLRMEYYDNLGTAVAQLSWASPSQPQEIVPQSQLYEPPGVFSLGSSSISVDEQAGAALVTVVRQLGSEGTVSVDYQTFAGSATESVDYSPQEGSVVFESGETEASISIPIANDDLTEAAENFTFTIDNVSGGGTLLAPRTATITIIDDDTILPSFDDFADSSSLTRNGSAATLSTVLRLTPAATSQAGSAYFNEPFLVTADTSFQTEFQFQLTGGSGGADGLVFVLQNSAAGLSALGSTGDAKGYGGIGQSLAVDFDTYKNSHDINNNHVSILSNGNVVTPLQTQLAPIDLNSGNIVNAWIDYNGTTNVIAVYISASGTKPAQPLVTATADLAGLVGSQAYLGFSAATGGLSNNHDVLNWQFRETAPPVLPPPEPGDTLQTETIATGIQEPIAIDWSDNGQNLLIAQKRGSIRVMRNGTLLPTPFIDIADQVNGTRDRGLLDIAVHPDFDSSPYVYLLFTYDPPEVFSHSGLAGPDGKGNRAGRLIRVTADPATDFTTAIPGTETILLGENSTWENFNGFVNSTVDFNEPPAGILPDGSNLQDFIASDSESHTVGSLAFATDGTLYVSIGDGTSYNAVDPRTVRVQDLDNLSGKILRIDPLTGDGLPDNPFYNGDPDANRSKVYEYGVRNPFRITVDPVSGQLYIGDVGWSTWEEVNSAGPGTNFGWPYYEGANGVNSQTNGYKNLPEAQAFYASGEVATPAIHALNHAATGINAIVMGAVYRGTTYPAEYEGDLFFNDLGQGIVRHASFDGQGNIESVDTFTTGANVVVQITQGPDGSLYYVDLDSNLVGRWVFVAGGGGPGRSFLPYAASDGDVENAASNFMVTQPFWNPGSQAVVIPAGPSVDLRSAAEPLQLSGASTRWMEHVTDERFVSQALVAADVRLLSYRGRMRTTLDTAGSVRTGIARPDNDSEALVVLSIVDTWHHGD